MESKRIIERTRKAVAILFVLGLLGLSACGGHNDVEGMIGQIPGITTNGPGPAAALPASPPDALTVNGCANCYTHCTGSFAVASTGFEFCNNNCVSACLNNNR